MTNYDTTTYQVFGSRGDWGLRVRDELGNFEYVNHFSTLADAKSFGNHYAAQYKLGMTTLEIFG